MSLIFSALAEIDEQARAHSAGHPPAASPRPPSHTRRWLAVAIAIVLVGAGGMGVYVLLQKTPAAKNPLVPVESVATATANVGTSPAPGVLLIKSPPAVTTVVPSQVASVGVSAVADAVAPYARQDQPVAPTAASGSDDVRVRIIRSQAAVPQQQDAAVSAVEAAVPVVSRSPSAPPAPRVPASVVATAQVPDAVLHASEMPASAVAAPDLVSDVKSPAQTADDAPTLGNNNYIKVGKQSEVDSDQGMASRVDAFNAAMSSGNHAQARDALAAIKTRLSPQSVTLLRMQAWYAMDSGDDVAALDLYQRILERLPDDVNAGVNVALIDWRASRKQAARTRIDELHTLHPDMALVTRYWQVMQDGG